MEILKWFNPTRWLMLLGLGLALIAGYFAWEHNIRADEKTKVDKVWEAKLDKQKVEAAGLLAAETARVGAIELKWSTFKNQQEIKDGKAQQVVAGYKNRIASLLSSNGGRLRDPNAEIGCRGSSGSAEGQIVPSPGNSTEYTAETGGLFSEEASRLFIELTSEADQINLAYASCRADSLNLRVSESIK